MGNLDLVIIINTKAFEIKGTEYEYRHQAIQQAVAKFEEYMNEIDKSRYDDDGELYKGVDETWQPEDITKIEIYEL